MGESASLRAKDYRTLFQVVGECRELGADPIAWRLHLLKAICAELGARVGAGGEATGIAQGKFIPLSTVDDGWENDDQRQAMFDWLELQAKGGAPKGLLPLKEPTTVHAILNRGEYYTDQQPDCLDELADYLRRSEVQDLLLSMHRIAIGPDHFCGLTIMRGLGDREFSSRDKMFLATLHREIAPLVGRQLAKANEPSTMRLSPRRRQVLDCLLEGMSEKQAATELGLTQPTVHQYVKAVYRHFHVYSRAELMARWVRFARGA